MGKEKANTLKAPAARSLDAALFAGRLLRWITENAYHTPTDEFATGLGAVWLSFCFDHNLNPFVEAHRIMDVFPFPEALGTTVPEWAKRSNRGNAAQPPSKDLP